MKKGFVIHHNGPPARCVGQPHSRCERYFAAVKNFHVNDQGWSDIAYSFGVCPHGIRFTGRGWDKNQFANGSDVVGPYDGKDSEWYTVLVFLGTDEKPTAEMVEGVKALIVEGRSRGRCGQRVLPHNAFKVKPCPGPEFTALAAVWDNNPTLGGVEGSDDMGVPTWAKEAWAWATGRGLVKDERPNEPITRAEMVVVLHRIHEAEGAFPSWSAKGYKLFDGLINEPKPNAPVTESRLVTLIERVRGRL